MQKNVPESKKIKKTLLTKKVFYAILFAIGRRETCKNARAIAFACAKTAQALQANPEIRSNSKLIDRAAACRAVPEVTYGIQKSVS